MSISTVRRAAFRTMVNLRQGFLGNELIPELFAADHNVFGTSLYNHTIPANVNAYLDHVVRIGVTVSPTCEGML